MSSCWMLNPKSPPVFVLLGRFGDNIIMLPAFREIQRRIGMAPLVIVSNEYASLYEGVSYVRPVPVPLHWWKGIAEAKALAKQIGGDGCCVPQWWNDPCPIPEEYRGSFTLQSHGHNHGVNLALWPNYMASMWSRAGFTVQEMMSLPLIFDRRSPEREARLVQTYYPKRDKPLLLLNWSGISSPFPYVPEVMQQIAPLRRHFHVADLSNLLAHRIYDLLGLYDVAAGMITIDTSLGHLAPASTMPYIAFTVGGWSGSTWRGNCALTMRYNETPNRLNDIVRVLEQWSAKKPEMALA